VSADTLRIVLGLALVAVTAWAPIIAIARLGALRGDARRRAHLPCQRFPVKANRALLIDFHVFSLRAIVIREKCETALIESAQ
jgi:hypothetical protein